MNAKSFDQVLGRAMQAGIRVFPLSVETKLATQDRDALHAAGSFGQA